MPEGIEVHCDLSSSTQCWLQQHFLGSRWSRSC
uniref:Uncharacterized protein n=1 Tax=Solanum lycopersicum TaxID=4081 RepID=A0A3Q7EEK6_SOLLC